MIPIRNNDHVSIGIDRLPTAWEDKPVMIGWLSSYLKENQALEDAVWTLLDNLTLNTTSEAMLDQIGHILNEPRLARTNVQYVPFLRASIAANRSKGRAEDILRVFSVLADTVIYDDFFPAGFRVMALGVDGAALIKLLDRIRANGTAGDLIYYEPGLSLIGQFDDDPTSGRPHIPGAQLGDANDLSNPVSHFSSAAHVG